MQGFPLKCFALFEGTPSIFFCTWLEFCFCSPVLMPPENSDYSFWMCLFFFFFFLRATSGFVATVKARIIFSLQWLDFSNFVLQGRMLSLRLTAPGILFCIFKEELFLQRWLFSHLCLTVPEKFLRAVSRNTERNSKSSVIYLCLYNLPKAWIGFQN